MAVDEQVQDTERDEERGFRGRLDRLVAELERQKASRVDFVADARSLKVVPDENHVRLAPADVMAGEWLSSEGLPLRPTALSQVGNHVSPEVPSRFLRALASDRPPAAAALLTDLMHATGRRNLVRCLDGHVRAYLSAQYRVLDHYDLAFTALDVARNVGGEVIEASLSDNYMRLKLTNRSVFDVIADQEGRNAGGSHTFLRQIGHGGDGPHLPGGPDTVHPSITISNSETGHGGLHVRLGILKAICLNMAVVEDVAAEVHLGGKLDTGLYSEETRFADSKAIMLKCRDAIQAAFNVEKFKGIVAKARQAAEDRIAAPQTAVGNLVKAVGLTEGEKDALLEHFLGDYGRTRYGLAQSVARMSQDVPDPDRAADLERFAGRIIAEPALVAVTS
jgi:hypothetical protein